MSSESFADLGVSQPVVAALAKRGFHKPFAVQSLAIADVLAGRDVLVQSPTGSGKTLAFGVPIADRLKQGQKGPAALVLAPTRELAEQIVDELDSVVRARGLSIAPVYGGVGLPAQAKRAAKADIVVATPGRLEDLLGRRLLSLGDVRILVLDEADRMLDMGFKPAVDRIVRLVPKGRQTLFFSATLEGAAGQLAASYTHDARKHVHAPEPEKIAAVEHRFIHLSHEGRIGALIQELQGDAEDGDRRTLVFVRTKRGADRLVKKLSQQKVHAVAMHGNKSQGQRRRALASFESGHIDTLVATDVASRGIDVDDITHVINFDMPEDSDTYVHRTGRTGRAGREGAAASFVLPDQFREMRQIAAAVGLSQEFDSAPGGRDIPSNGGGKRPNRQRSNGNGNGRSGNGGNGGNRNGGGRTKSYGRKRR